MYVHYLLQTIAIIISFLVLVKLEAVWYYLNPVCTNTTDIEFLLVQTINMVTDRFLVKVVWVDSPLTLLVALWQCSQILTIMQTSSLCWVQVTVLQLWQVTPVVRSRNSQNSCLLWLIFKVHVAVNATNHLLHFDLKVACPSWTFCSLQDFNVCSVHQTFLQHRNT